MPQYLATVYYWRTETIFVEGVDEEDAADKVYESYGDPNIDIQDVSLQLVSSDDSNDEEAKQ